MVETVTAKDQKSVRFKQFGITQEVLSQVRDPRTENGWILYEKALMGNVKGQQYK